MTRRTQFLVAGRSLVVEARDAWSALAIDELFAGWHLAPGGEVVGEVGGDAGGQAAAPAIVMQSAVMHAAVPAGLPAFPIAAGGTCHTDGELSYIELDGSMIAIGRPGRADVEVCVCGSPAIGDPGLTRIVSYALAAALRRRRLFELHAAALVDPGSGDGLLIIGPSGSGKSTLTVNLASAGWPFLTDDVLLLSPDAQAVTAWPLRRCFAITAETFAASRFLQERRAIDATVVRGADKQLFLPDKIFPGEFKGRCTPATLIFSELNGGDRSAVSRLTTGETMARLLRMSPWSCYDRATAADHLAVLAALAKQSTGYALLAGRDLLDAGAAVALVAGCRRKVAA